jgi:hypothetical protein
MTATKQAQRTGNFWPCIWSWLSVDKIAAIVTIAGIVFAVWQYLVIKQDGRVAATLGYVTRFSSAPVFDSFKNIYTAWGSEAGYAIQHSADPGSIAQKKIAFIIDQHLEWDAVVVGDYFDQLYICVRENICDLPLAVTMLGRDIETVYVYSGRYLDAMRSKRGGNTGCGLAALYWLAAARLAYGRLDEQQRRESELPEMKVTQHACPPV